MDVLREPVLTIPFLVIVLLLELFLTQILNGLLLVTLVHVLLESGKTTLLLVHLVTVPLLFVPQLLDVFTQPEPVTTPPTNVISPLVMLPSTIVTL
jgi:hypothetical protein